MDWDHFENLFFRLLMNDSDRQHFDEFINEMFAILIKAFNLQNVSIWKEIGSNLFLCQYSSNDDVKGASKSFSFKDDEQFVVYKEKGRLFLQYSAESSPKMLLEFRGGRVLHKLSNQQLEKISKICFAMFFHGKKLYLQKTLKEKYYQLFLLTDELYSIMKEEEVLNKLYNTLRQMYPDLLCHFVLPMDYSLGHEIPVKNLEQEIDQYEEAMTAFLKGDMVVRSSSNGLYIYVPIAGRQGVYGLIDVHIPLHIEQIDDVIDMIEKVAKAGGKALENAKLYEQSKQHVNDLQLINDTARKINKNLRISDTMKYMVKRMLRSFSADEAAFFIFDENKKWNMLSESTSFFHSDESKAYVDWVAQNILEQNSVFTGDISNSILGEAVYKSIMAVPMIDSEKIIGFAVVLRKEPYSFTFDMYKLMESLVSHSTLAFTNSMLREKLELLVITDPLTNLFNRKYFDEVVHQSFKEDQRGTLILIDVDNFKQINDTYGHQVGDKVLIQIAKTIRNNIREEDVGARWGGEELAIYLPKVGLKIGCEVANRIVSAVRKSTKPPVTVSCGVSCWDAAHKNDSPALLFKRADDALYQAKRNGKNQVSVLDQERA
ncbi:sensor domain-containing diguanylate cyclase [Aeribacillus sp. FSL K6-1121]|jgi:diguanylate cyclase (GGDEF)-like protein|uniref:GGDEF domain-containing protein n=1 Tax=Aeribacillus pallidus TaxID=33936 RepID=A0A161ZUZ5_9BACI|nr:MULTISPECIES: sensor domain-containing diguanylate cyclase [Aeribacillus]KZN97107.1 hypothetical protein AZI98_05990 [Aeribacillus pallidus]MED1442433.1 sensor domain-containing diguanylate cyclase [Aeribacillus composti]